mmetsp:Transcript_25000/g.40524  ORF Transcript_25000/g.40524 Transcript_25000/m.40524 type:complete len:285 (+) Transcript_25000:214-1068(+)
MYHLSLSTCRSRSILHPRSSPNRTNTRCLSNIRKLCIFYRLETELCHVSPWDTSSLTINHINHTSRLIHRQSTRPYNAIFQPTLLHSLLLIILIIKNLLHDGHHENFECKWCLIFGISGSDTGNDCHAFDSFGFHCGYDVVCSVCKHGVSDIRSFPTQSNNNSINIILKHLGHIGSVGNIPTKYSQVIIDKWLIGIRSTRSLGYQNISRVTCQSDDGITIFECLVDTFLSGQSGCSEDGDVGVESCRAHRRWRFVGDKGRCAADEKGGCDGGELHGDSCCNCVI